MSRTVLVVDDSKTMRELVGFTLTGAGHKVLEGADGSQGLAVLAANKVDLIISDVNMPVMDGLTFVRKLRALPAYKFTPVLMLTTESTPEKREAGKQAGATAWIVKPFNPEQLKAVLAKVLP
jgi:two-component system chemotaxis response regulator CheY